MSNPKTTKAAVTPPPYIPEGLRRTTGDVVGFHDLESQGPIYGIPMGAKLSDSDLKEQNASCFVIFQILEDNKLGPCKCYEGSGDERVELVAKPGEMVGVWTKPGMKPIFQACGRKVFMAFAGEKKLKGKPESFNPMKLYDCHISEGPAKLVPLIEDNRVKSKNAKTPWSKAAWGQDPQGDTEDDLGF